MRPGEGRQAGARGYTYLGVLLLVLVTSAGAAALGPLWSAAAQRERERELLAVGDEFRRAIGSYRALAVNGRREYPRTLEDLLRDPRVPGVRRHLRRIYADPATGVPEWGLITAPEGGIMGVHSLSQRAPRQRAGFPEADAEFARAERLADWHFVVREPARSAPPAGWRPAPAAPR